MPGDRAGRGGAPRVTRRDRTDASGRDSGSGSQARLLHARHVDVRALAVASRDGAVGDARLRFGDAFEDRRVTVLRRGFGGGGPKKKTGQGRGGRLFWG